MTQSNECIMQTSRVTKHNRWGKFDYVRGESIAEAVNEGTEINGDSRSDMELPVPERR